MVGAILNFFRPKGIADAIWQASDPQLETPVGEKWAESEAPIFMHVWWVAWILTSLASRFYWNMSRSIDTVAEGQNANLAGLIADGLAVVAGVLKIMFVKGADEQTRGQGPTGRRGDSPTCRCLAVAGNLSRTDYV